MRHAYLQPKPRTSRNRKKINNFFKRKLTLFLHCNSSWRNQNSRFFNDSHTNKKRNCGVLFPYPSAKKIPLLCHTKNQKAASPTCYANPNLRFQSVQIMWFKKIGIETCALLQQMLIKFLIFNSNIPISFISMSKDQFKPIKQCILIAETLTSDYKSPSVC